MTPAKLEAQGLYDPAHEHDACGVGFVANIQGQKSHDMIHKGIEVLQHLEHRGACGCDPDSGDGAGLLVQIPDAFLRRAMAQQGIALPAPGEYAVGMIFLAQDGAAAARQKEILENAVAEEGQRVLGWREVPIDDIWHADGIYNKKVKGELLTEIRIPAPSAGHRGAYGKLRDRGSIDFPLFGVAVRLDVAGDGRTVQDADVCAVALQARPVRIKKAAELLAESEIGSPSFDEAVEVCARAAFKQCHPLDNITVDKEWRRAMVPVLVRRALGEIAAA